MPQHLSLCETETRSLWQELTAGGGGEQNRDLLFLTSLLKIPIPQMFHKHRAMAKMEEKRSLHVIKATKWNREGKQGRLKRWKKKL